MRASLAAAWIGTLAVAAAVRLWRVGTLPPNAAEARPLLGRPLHHPPLLDLVTALLAPERRAAIALVAGLAAVAGVGLFVRRGLGDGPALLAMGLATVTPPMVFLGSWWGHESLTAAFGIGTALLLVRVLDDGPTRGRLAALAASGTALGLSAWSGPTSLLAWMSWLAVFAPWWLESDRAVAAAKALGVASLIVVLVYVGLLAAGADPRTALAASRAPTGLAALQLHLDAVAGALVGRVGRYPVPARLGLVVVTVGLALLGWRRTAPEPERRSAWGPVLLVGVGGGLGVALLFHPWLPLAAEKPLWATSPLLLCLVVAAVWPATAPVARALGAAPTTLRAAPLALALAFALPGCTDEDGDGVSVQAGDCDDGSESVHPGAPEVWGDGVDNDCDDRIDDSDDYRFLTELEPNDTTLGGCFAPAGQALGDIAAFGLLNRLTGRISSVVDDSYDEGDRDCYQLRFPDEAGHPRLEVRLSWDDPDADLDFAVQGLWEGAQSGFALQDQPGPGPEFAVTSAGFDGGQSLWVWVIGYSGPPTDYTLDLVLR